MSRKKFDEHNDNVDDDAGGVDADAAGDTDVFVFVFHRWWSYFLMNVKFCRAASYQRNGNCILCVKKFNASGDTIVFSNHATFLDDSTASGVGPNLFAWRRHIEGARLNEWMKPADQWRIGRGSPLKAQTFVPAELTTAAPTLEDERATVCSIFVPSLEGARHNNIQFNFTFQYFTSRIQQANP